MDHDGDFDAPAPPPHIHQPQPAELNGFKEAAWRDPTEYTHCTSGP
jgi:hypothetical protein